MMQAWFMSERPTLREQQPVTADLQDSRIHSCCRSAVNVLRLSCLRATALLLRRSSTSVLASFARSSVRCAPLPRISSVCCGAYAPLLPLPTVLPLAVDSRLTVCPLPPPFVHCYVTISHCTTPLHGRSLAFLHMRNGPWSC